VGIPTPELAVFARSVSSIRGVLCVAVAIVLTWSLPLELHAQVTGGSGGTMQPMCVSGCLPNYAVSVTPDGGTAPDRSATTGGYTASFTIANTGQLTDTYYLSCSSVTPVTCDGLSQSQVTVLPAKYGHVTASYSVGNPGTGSLTLHVNGEASDVGSYSVHVVTPPASPIVLLTPWNGAVRDLSACVNACFEKVVTHATPAYISMDVPRSFGLTYASGSVRPTPVVWVNALRPSGATSLAIGLQRISTGGNLTLLNGSTSAWYAISGDTVRMAAAFDALANGITSSGVYGIRVTVTANFASGPSSSTTLTTTVPIVVTRGGAFGDGVWPSGLPRLLTTTDAGGEALIESDGSIFYYGAGHPGGTTASVSGNSRIFLDGSSQAFDANGLPIVATDRYGNATHYYWTAAQLDSVVDPMGKRIALAYNGGKLATATDPGGRVTHYTINGSNQLVTIQDPDTVSTQFAYDGLGLLTTVMGRNGAAWTTTYDELRRVKSDSAPAVLLADGTTKRPTVTYLPAERVVWQPQTAGTSAATAKAAVKADTIRADVTDPLGARSRFKMDRFGAPLLAIGPLGATTTFTRDTAGRVTQTVEPNGHVTQVTYGYEDVYQGVPYNPYLVQESRDASKGKGVSYAYNTTHDVTAIFGSYGDPWVVRRDFTYDTFHRLSTVKIGGSSIASATYAYDTLSRVISVTDAEGHRQASAYDSTTGNLSISINPLQDSTRRHFDVFGRTDSTYAPNGAVTGTQYGLLNQVLAAKNPLGYTTQTRYNPDLSVQRIIDAKGQVYKFSYNAVGWPTARFDLADTTKADSVWYDAAGQVKRTRTRRGNVLSANYDIVGRLDSLLYRRPGASVDTMYAWFAYDTLGKRVQASNWSQSDSLSYDNLGQLTSWQLAQGGERYRWAYQYDLQGRLTSRLLYKNDVSQTAGSLSRSYDGYGQLTSTTAAGVNLSFFRAQLDSLVNQWVVNPGLPGSWWRTTLHDSTHAADEDSLSIPALDAKYGVDILHDSLGRLSGTDVHGSVSGSRRYRYDLAGQLLQACTYQGAPCIGEYATTLAQDAYGYDATGNRKDPSIGAVIGAGNRVTWFKGYSITYDADGNIISKSGNGEVWTYTWDPFDKLTDVTLNGTLVYHFVYDAFGNRVDRCTVGTCSAGEREINDGSQLVFARNGSGTVTDEYGFYPGGDQPMSLRLPSGRTGVFITDPQLRGTVRAIADADKNTTNMEFKTYSISPWGVVPADTGSVTRLRMAGQPYDQGSRLYYMRARYYDPDLGRFLSEDPIGISGGLNLYAYAGNDPVNHDDPSGTYYRYTEQGLCQRMAIVHGTYDVQTGEVLTIYKTGEYEDCKSGPGDGKGAGGETTMGRAPADTGCKILSVTIPGLGRLLGRLGGMTANIGLTIDAFVPDAFGWTGAAGLAFSAHGVSTYKRTGGGAGSDVSAAVEVGLANSFSGPAVEAQVQGGPLSGTFSGAPVPNGLHLEGVSVSWGTPSPTGGSFHAAGTFTTTNSIIRCE
jgi:RHS repeat-associated protein